ncbi:beta strand repeat-containing protein [Acidithiobacillus sulfuriphilus]|uniref:beta strand repeat-containing protein n=1 Tax=Acidithiobacillus sulfuriphilus TaxID=1867749 RepID=UPI003F5E2D1D
MSMYRTDQCQQFRRRTLVVSIGAVLATLAAAPAFAAPSPGQVPGQGNVIYSGGTTVTASTYSLVGPYTSGETITITGTAATPAVVLQWGGSSASTLNSSGTPGFNIGNQASVTIANNATGPGNNPIQLSVLNIDASGNPSQLYGQLVYTGGTTAGPGSLWVANPNGIVVGTTAVINAPNGLALLNDPAATSLGFAQSFASGSVPINFQGGNNIANVGVAIQSGASLGSVGGFLLVAGYGSVNIASAAPSTVPLIVDGGIGANVTTTANVSAGNLIANDNSSVPGYYTDALTTVAVSLGTTAAPFTNLNAIVDGDIVNTGVLTVTQGQINWINGTFANDGTLNVSAAAGQSYGVLGFNTFATSTYIPSGLTSSAQTLYGNTSSAAPTGNFTNLGTVNATGSSLGQVFFVEGFQNNYGATLSVSGSLYIDSSSNGVTLAGTVSTLSGNLVIAAFGAYTLGIYTPVSVTGTSSSISLYGNQVDITQPLSATGASSTFNYVSIEPGSAQLNLAATGSITANTVNMGTSGPALSNFGINGTIDGVTSVVFGSTNSPTGDVSGAGTITTNNLTFANLQGSVNNITSGVIALNGFHLQAGTTGTMNITVNADGSSAQGINLNLTGNGVINSGNTVAIGSSGAQPANINSILYVQASGTLQVDAGTGPNNYTSIAVPNTSFGLFQFPGLVYLQSQQSVTVGTSGTPVVIANAYSPLAQVGRAGVFLIAPTINYYANVLYTNGNAGVVFAAPYNGLGFPNAVINGNAPTPTSYVTDYMPTVYFMRSVPVSATYPYGLELVPTDTFTNANGQLQQFQTFLNLY